MQDGYDTKYGKNTAIHIAIIFLIWRCGDSFWGYARTETQDSACFLTIHNDSILLGLACCIYEKGYQNVAKLYGGTFSV